MCGTVLFIIYKILCNLCDIYFAAHGRLLENQYIFLIAGSLSEIIHEDRSYLSSLQEGQIV